MIPKAHKFPLRTQFIAFRSRAKVITTPHLRILYHFSSSDLLNRSELSVPTRLAVIVPKKVAKLAVTRNYLKRLVYGQLWPLIKDRKIDCVVIFKPLSLTKSLSTQQALIQEIQNLKIQIQNND